MNQRGLTIKDLEAAGYQFKRHGGRHDIYYNPKLRSSIPLKRHDFDETDRRNILSEIKKAQGGG